MLSWLYRPLIGGLVVTAALVFCGSQARAVPVHVTLQWPGNAPVSVRPRIVAIQRASSSGAVASVEVEAKREGTVLELHDGIWQVQASATGYWSQEVQVMVPSQAAANVRLRFWPASYLHGEIVAAAGEALPERLEVRLSATPASAGKTVASRERVVTTTDGPIRAELQCGIAARKWSCMGPAGWFDMRLQAADYAPQYAWDVSLAPQSNTNFGPMELRRTGSVFGRAVRQGGLNPPGPCRAFLQLDPERQSPGDAGPGAERAVVSNTRFSVPLNAQGYFQIVGVAPGRYRVFVACPAASGLRELRVQADRETRIDPPVMLGELAFNMSLTPKVDANGRPWQVTLDETSPHWLRIVTKATSAEGRWMRGGLMPGKYQVTVSSSDGTRWLQRYFDLRKGSASLALRLGEVRVAGRVLLSSQPVRARLFFFNNAGGESATLTSDDEGRFQGVLPGAAANQASSWTVEAHVAQPPVTQRLLNVSVEPPGGEASAWLDLDLPAVAVHGNVVSPNGKPQRGVEVIFEGSSGIRTTTSTDDAGRFEMPDLPPGKYTAVADSPDGSSDRTPFHVGEGRGSELLLVLNPFKRVTFYVASSDGPVANAAVQVWIAPGVPRAFAHTDQEGRFEVSLPPGAAEVGLTIGAQGYALKLVRMRVPSESDASAEARTITLDTAAGTLVLNYPPAGRASDSFSTLYLVHNGAIQDARTIAGWGSDHAGNNVNGPAVIEAIEPGDYALCLIDPSNVAALWSGRLPSDRCSKGTVEEDETLTLRPEATTALGSMQ